MISFTRLLSYCAVICLLLNGCSAPDSDSGSSITTGTSGIFGTSNQEPTSTSSTNVSTITPEIVIQDEVPPLELELETFSKEVGNYITDFDIYNQRILTSYDLYLQYPESEKALNDYLLTIMDLEALLRKPYEELIFTPPEDYEDLTISFIQACFDLSISYQDVRERMSSGYRAETAEEIAAFQSFTAEVMSVTDRFSSTGYALITALGYE